MRHAHLHAGRVAMRRSLSQHRPRTRPPSATEEMRMSDIVLAVLGVALLGAVALMAGAALVGRTLAV